MTGSGRENGHLVTGHSRPTSQPKIHLLQEASQPCPRPTAQHPLKLHRRDSCPIHHPRQASTRPASAPASIDGHFLSHLQLLPSQAGKPVPGHAPRGQRAGTVSPPRKLGGRPPPLGQGPSWSLSTAHNSARNTHLPISQKGKMGSGSSSPCICPRPPAGRRTQVGLGAPLMAALCGVEVCALTPLYAGPLLPRGWGGREAGPTHPLCGLAQCSAQSVTPRRGPPAASGDQSLGLWGDGTQEDKIRRRGPLLAQVIPTAQVSRQCCGLHAPGPPYLGQARPGLCPQERAHTALG